MSASQAQRLKGRVAIVTGGARGIGLAISRDFVEQGANVVIADSGGEIDGTSPKRETAESVAKSLGDSAVAYASDIGTPEAAAEAVHAANERWGRLDLIVN